MRKQMFKFHHLISILFFLNIYLHAQSTFQDISRLAELEKRAIELDSLYNVDARKYVDVYFELGDIYVELQQWDKAYEALKKGLRLDSGNYQYQKLMADVEIEKELYSDAYNRLGYIQDKLKSLVHIYNKAESISNVLLKKHQQQLTFIERPSLLSHSIIAVKYPGVDQAIFKAICSRIEQEFRINVHKKYVDIYEDKKNQRDKHEEYYDNTIRDIFERNTDEVINNFMSKYGITHEDLTTREGKEHFVRSIYYQKENGEQIWNQIQLSIKDQYDANILIAQMRRKYQDTLDQNNNIRGVLAVSGQDIYAGENNNFLFGQAQGNYAVMSVYRFITKDTGYTTILKRAVMQAFSSTGHIIGIPRCTTITCVRAYPHSLEEHDRKDDRLCHECLQNLHIRYNDIMK